MNAVIAGLLGVVLLGSAALPALADTKSTSTAPVPPGWKHKKERAPVPPTITNSVDLACVQAAVKKRETGLIAAWDAFDTKIHNGMVVRQTGLVDAWGIATSSDRKAKIKDTESKWKQVRKEARAGIEKDREAALTLYKEEVKKCRKN